MKSIITILLVLLGNSAFSQQIVSAENYGDNWTLLQEKDGVEIFVRKAECERMYMKEALIYTFIKVKNNTANDLSIDFQVAHQYEDRCAGCAEQTEHLKSITVPANSTIENDCKFENSALSALIDNPNLHNLNAPLVLKQVELVKFNITK